MRIGFVSPSFRMLEVNWQHDYEMVKLGVPTVMGYLYRDGIRELRHWDFDAQVCSALEEDPEAFDLHAYFNKELVLGFLQGTDETLRAQTEKLLDVLGTCEQDIFGISLSAVLDRISHIMALASTAQCLAKVLKDRHPNSIVVIGGLQASPDSQHPTIYKQILEECPFIDYAYSGQGDERAVQLFRNIIRGIETPAKDIGLCFYRGQLIDGTSVILAGEETRFDPDNRPPSIQTSHHPAHTKSVAEARLAARNADDSSCQASEPTTTVPVSSLVRRTEEAPQEAYPSADEPHFYDVDEPDASKAGAQSYDELPARVPYFDRELVQAFRYSGRQIMKRFHFSEEQMLQFSRYENDTIVVLPHIFVKGCNAPCGFCTYAYRKIEGEHVEETVSGLRWLSEHYQCNSFHFLNTQINSVYAYAEAFCDEIIRQNLKILWSDCCNMRALDERLLEKMRRAGAMRLVYGVEAPEDEMLRYIRKGVDVAKVERLLKASHELGIWNHMLLIAGMPHETPEKQDKMMDFLVRTAPTVDFYTVSSFYLIANSPWGREPEKFGIDRTSNPSDLLEQQAFNEAANGRWSSDGLRWPEKKQQIIDSTRRFYQTISSAKGQSRCVGGNIDLYLLMWLYNALGHDRKSEITKIYVETSREIGHLSAKHEQQETVPENVVRMVVPVVVGRMNEGDQSSLVHVPVDLYVSPKSDQSSHFCASSMFDFAYKTPSVRDVEQFGKNTMTPVKENIPQVMNTLGKLLAPFAKALEAKLKPESASQMAKLLAINLPRYNPFTHAGYVILGQKPQEPRSQMQRMLQWSGVVS